MINKIKITFIWSPFIIISSITLFLLCIYHTMLDQRVCFIHDICTLNFNHPTSRCLPKIWDRRQAGTSPSEQRAFLSTQTSWASQWWRNVRKRCISLRQTQLVRFNMFCPHYFICECSQRRDFCLMMMSQGRRGQEPYSMMDLVLLRT